MNYLSVPSFEVDFANLNLSRCCGLELSEDCPRFKYCFLACKVLRRIFTSLIQDKNWNKDTLIFSRLLNSVFDRRIACFFFNRKVICAQQRLVDFEVVWSWWKIQVEDTALRLLPICYIVYTKSNPINFASIKSTRSAVSAINSNAFPQKFLFVESSCLQRVGSVWLTLYFCKMSQWKASCWQY